MFQNIIATMEEEGEAIPFPMRLFNIGSHIRTRPNPRWPCLWYWWPWSVDANRVYYKRRY